MSILTSVFPKLTEGPGFDEDGRGAPAGVRNALLQDLCRGKRVLHVGCARRPSRIQAEIAERNWLHGLITECSSYTLGVDADAAAVRAASRIAKMDNMVAGDVAAPDPIAEISRQQFDVALFGEVVDHLPNPVEFLRRFRKTYRTNFRKIIIRAPNAFRAEAVLARHGEASSPDRRFFFTPHTISKIALDAGFQPESVTMAAFTRLGRLKSWFLNLPPLLAEDIVLVASHET